MIQITRMALYSKDHNNLCLSDILGYFMAIISFRCKKIGETLK